MRRESPEMKAAYEFISRIPRFTKKKHTAQQMRDMISALHALPEGKTVIHVAGTNGKGSVCAFLESIFRESGRRTALFTSPHLVSVTERFCFDGKPVEEPVFLSAFAQVQACFGTEAGEGYPSFFEFLFLMFLAMVRDSEADTVILETGLGGRLDATNCFEQPDLTVITSVSLDHMEYLGNTVSAIAAEKAGILKAGVPAVYDCTSKEAAQVISETAERLGCPSCPIGKENVQSVRLTEEGIAVLPAGEGFPSEEYRVSLFGEYQAVNSLLAYRAASLLGIGEKDILRGLALARWPGRMEQAADGVFLDGAHNEGGIRSFAETARKIAAGRGGRTLLLFSAVEDKEYRKMAADLCLDLHPSVLFLTGIRDSRGLETEELYRAFEETEDRDLEIRCFDRTADALTAAENEKGESDTLFIVGSLYLIGEVKALLEENEDE